MQNDPDRAAVDVEIVTSRRWLALAIGVLVLAGVLALALVVGRMPPFDRWVGDPAFFRRCLVVHVDLSLVVWFYAFVGALFGIVPRATRRGPLGRVAPWLAAAGVAWMVAAAAIPAARPVLSNYVPMIDHRAFAVGLLAFGGAVLVPAASALRAVRGRSFLPAPPAAIAGLRATAAALLLAALTFGISWVERPRGVEPDVHYELLFWGLGHVLQLASTAAMLTAWILLLSRAGRAPLSGRAAAWLFAALVLPWCTAPMLAIAGTQSAAYRVGFTHLMQLGIAPAVVAFLAIAGGDLVRAARAGELPPRHPAIVAFLASASLTLLGYVLGSLIRGSNTMVPAHYHANIGAVTAAFMGVTWMLLERLGIGIAPSRRRLAAIQPASYAIGQAVFAAGFGLAGAHGTMRKAYGAEQHARGLGETIGLCVMGIGGIVAIAAGLLFLFLVVTAWRRARVAERRSHAPLGELGSPAWIESTIPDIPSRS